MDILEKINRVFAGWYEGLFAAGEDVRPKDILRKVLFTLESYRKEGLDNQVYVPNQYVLELALEDDEEREALLSFLDEEELCAVIRRYCQQNRYAIRGDLEVTIKEVPVESLPAKERVRVRCRFTAPKRTKTAASAPIVTAPASPPLESAEEDSQEPGTVASVWQAKLIVSMPGKPAYAVPLPIEGLSIGRSAKQGNQLVLEGDGMVSRRHARIEREADGRYTLYDLGATNGTTVNGRRVDNCTLQDGDEIVIGATRIRFRQTPPSEPDAIPRHAARPVNAASPDKQSQPRLILTDSERDLEVFVLSSETLIGRGITNDIVLPDRSVATRHARLVRGAPSILEALDSEHETLLNGQPVLPGKPIAVLHGDVLRIGVMTLRYEEGKP
jgi:pSer/pThr/pTyr-binding forkhead associated (FHA) protein